MQLSARNQLEGKITNVGKISLGIRIKFLIILII